MCAATSGKHAHCCGCDCRSLIEQIWCCGLPLTVHVRWQGLSSKVAGLQNEAFAAGSRLPAPRRDIGCQPSWKHWEVPAQHHSRALVQYPASACVSCPAIRLPVDGVVVANPCQLRLHCSCHMGRDGEDAQLLMLQGLQTTPHELPCLPRFAVKTGPQLCTICTSASLRVGSGKSCQLLAVMFGGSSQRGSCTVTQTCPLKPSDRSSVGHSSSIAAC